MPIINLTDGTESRGLTQALPRIATLRKGAQKSEQRWPGRDLEYFRVEFAPEYAYLAPIWSNLYGDQPREFQHVYLSAPAVQDAFPTWMEDWSATGLLRRCDGERQVLMYDPGSGSCKETNAPCVRESGGCNCRRVGRLPVFLPDLCAAAGVVGWIMVSTHSVHDILNVYNYLSWISAGGRRSLLGIEFVLGRAPRQVSYFDQKEGRRVKITKSLLYLTASPDYVSRVLIPAVISGEVSQHQLDDLDAAMKLLEHSTTETEPAQLGDESEFVPPASPVSAVDECADDDLDHVGTVWRTGRGAALIKQMRDQGLTRRDPEWLAALLEEMGGLVNTTMSPAELVQRMKDYKLNKLSALQQAGQAAVQTLSGMPPTYQQMRSRTAPFAADVIRAFVLDRVAQLSRENPGWLNIAPSNAQKRLLANLFAEASLAKTNKERSDERHAMIGWLLGKRGVSELNSIEFQAIIDWIGDEEGRIHAQAYLEYAFVLEVARTASDNDQESE